jgi:hypothetical protein
MIKITKVAPCTFFYKMTQVKNYNYLNAEMVKLKLIITNRGILLKAHIIF